MMKFKRSFLSIALNTFLLVALLTVSGTSVAQMKGLTPDAPPKIYLPIVTVSGHPSTFGIVNKTFDTAGGLNQAVTAGSAWGRLSISWKDTQATENGPYNWNSNFDAQMKAAAASNIKVVLDIEGTPTWARDSAIVNVSACDDSGGRISASKYGEWSNFVQAVVTRYGASPYNLQNIEFYNEEDAPNMFGCWGDSNDPTYYGGKLYGNMLKATYPAVKALNPGVSVMVGGLLLDCDPRKTVPASSCIAPNFLKGILAAGAGPYFDGISFHGYDYFGGTIGLYHNGTWFSDQTTGPVVLNKADYLNSVLASYNVSGKFLMSTESSFVCQTKCQAAVSSSDNETSKAYYIAQVSAVSLAANFRANIWYQMYQDASTGNEGLLKADQSPLPAYYSYQFTASKLGSAAFTQQVKAYSGVSVYAFTASNGKTLWVLWSLDGSTHTVSLASLPSAVTVIGTDGKPTVKTASQTISVGYAPVFVEW